MAPLTARQALQQHHIAATREDLEHLDDRAWQLYGDICRTPDATQKDRLRAFDAAMTATRMLLDHDNERDANDG